MKKVRIVIMTAALFVFTSLHALAAEHLPDTTLVDALVGIVTDVIALFMEPPLVWFIVLGLIAAGIGIVKGLIPRKRAR